MRAWRRQETFGSISFLIYLGIFALSSLPASALPTSVPDIIPHFLEYALLAFFFVQMFRSPKKPRMMALALALLILLAALDELHQWFVPTRFCSLKDLLVDAIGSLAGIAAFFFLRRWAARPHQRSWARWLGDYFSRP
jgi:VanZ family protein